MHYRSYAESMKEKYGEKVYKLPVNIPVTCPNRDGTRGYGGCIFCGASGSGYELLSDENSVTRQLTQNADYIGSRYKAKKFIAYFQSFTNTWCSDEAFEAYLREAAAFPGVVGISVSTRPDAISERKFEIMKSLQEEGCDITVELGLQSVNEETLRILNRGHTLEEYLECAEKVRENGLDLCTHLIVDLPWDSDEDVFQAAEVVNRFGGHVKLHSLYVEKGTKLAQMYENGEVRLLEKEDFIRRASGFLARLDPEVIVDRLIGRVPEEVSVVANWHTSWWKVRDELFSFMDEQGLFQGVFFHPNAQELI